MNRTDMLEWLKGKIAEAEKSLKAREQMEKAWRSGDDESWARMEALAGAKPTTKAERLRKAEAQGRMAAKCRVELEMFKAVYAAILAEPSTTAQGRER